MPFPFGRLQVAFWRTPQESSFPLEVLISRQEATRTLHLFGAIRPGTIFYPTQLLTRSVFATSSFRS